MISAYSEPKLPLVPRQIGTIAATLAGAIAMIGNMLQWAAFFGGGQWDSQGAGGFLGSLEQAIAAPLAAMMIQMAVSRSREFPAD